MNGRYNYDLVSMKHQTEMPSTVKYTKKREEEKKNVQIANGDECLNTEPKSISIWKSPK